MKIDWQRKGRYKHKLVYVYWEGGVDHIWDEIPIEPIRTRTRIIYKVLTHNIDTKKDRHTIDTNITYQQLLTTFFFGI